MSIAQWRSAADASIPYGAGVKRAAPSLVLGWVITWEF